MSVCRHRIPVRMSVVLSSKEKRDQGENDWIKDGVCNSFASLSNQKVLFGSNSHFDLMKVAGRGQVFYTKVRS